LPSEQDPAKPELDSQGFLIDAFQEPRPEVTVNFYPGSDDATSEVINALARLRENSLGVLAVFHMRVIAIPTTKLLGGSDDAR
jgi:hypothetical protein